MARAREQAQVPGLTHLVAAMATLEARLEVFIDEFKRERDGAAQHRRDLRDVIGALSGSVKTLSDHMAEIKPLVSDYRENRDQARGAVRLGRWLWGAALAGAAAGGAFIAEMVKLVKG